MCCIGKISYFSRFLYFGAVYAFDFVLNIIAKGVIAGPFSLLQDPYGWLDMFLLLPYFVNAHGRQHVFSGLRMIKIVQLVPSKYHKAYLLGKKFYESLNFRLKVSKCQSSILLL